MPQLTPTISALLILALVSSMASGSPTAKEPTEFMKNGNAGKYFPTNVNVKHLGCFEDSNDRVLSGTLTYLNDTNSPENCIYLCSKLGNKYAGVENGNECFCGNKRPGDDKKRREEDCGKSCPNSKEKCGGFWRLSAYTIESPPLGDLSDVNVKHLGCFEDSNDRVLSGTLTYLNDTNSPENCIYLCSKLGNKYAGVENGNECFCGNKRPGDDKKRREEDCGKSCPNSKEKCGGFWRLSAYTIESPPLGDLSDVNVRQRHLGCFEDSNDRILSGTLTYLNETNSPKICIPLCYKLGNKYAGVENGNECFCGNERPGDDRKRREEDCGKSCPNSKEKCGGFWRLSAYTIWLH